MKQLLYFSAQWCPPCRMLGPIMEELQLEGYPIQKIDVDADPDLAQSFKIKNIPTVVLTVEGVDSGRKLGLNPKSMYIELYNQN